MTTQELEELFVDIASQHEECEPIIDNLRSLESMGEITHDEYDYLMSEWDNLLKKYNL